MNDAFELVFALDFAFRVELAAPEAARMQTPGQLLGWILPLLRERLAPDQMVPDIFETTLEKFAQILPQAKPIDRATKLDRVLPRNAGQRYQTWTQLSYAPLALPPLEFASWIETGWGIALYSLPFGILIGAMQISRDAFWLLLTAFVLLLFVLPPLFRRARTIATRPPFPTVGDAVDYLVLHNYWHLVMERGGWSEAEAWRVLQNLIAREADVEPDLVQRDSDLGELLA